MIGRLRGCVAHKQPPYLLLDVAGVGYELETPLSTWSELPDVGAEVTLYTHLMVREDAHVLYGFRSLNERAVFRDLIRITGVGAKLALVVLSGMDAAGLVRCVRDNNLSALTRLPGIGKKTAERLIIELRDRIEHLAVELPTISTAPTPALLLSDPLEDAQAALVSLGYKPADASHMLAAVASEGLDSAELIRLALQASLRR